MFFFSNKNYKHKWLVYSGTLDNTLSQFKMNTLWRYVDSSENLLTSLNHWECKRKEKREEKGRAFGTFYSWLQLLWMDFAFLCVFCFAQFTSLKRIKCSKWNGLRCDTLIHERMRIRMQTMSSCHKMANNNNNWNRTVLE